MLDGDMAEERGLWNFHSQVEIQVLRQIASYLAQFIQNQELYLKRMQKVNILKLLKLIIKMV